MDQDQDNLIERPPVNLSTLPAELLVIIISFLSSARDRVNLRYVSQLLKCVMDGTSSVWKEFVWVYYGKCDEDSVKEVLKVSGWHIKVLSFPNSAIPSTLLEMLHYCSNVQHLSLSSTVLDPEQLQKIIHYMGCLQTLEFKVLKVGDGSDIKQLLLNTGQLRELTIISDNIYYLEPRELFKYWKIVEYRPLQLNLIASVNYGHFERLAYFVTELPTISTGITANFRVYNKSTKVPLKSSPTLPLFQLQFEGSGQVFTPCVKFSDFGILGLENDVAVMTNCQYGGKTVYMVKYQVDRSIMNQTDCNI